MRFDPTRRVMEGSSAADNYGARVLLTPCPTCGALLGERCSRDGAVIGPHNERVKAVRRIGRRS